MFRMLYFSFLGVMIQLTTMLLYLDILILFFVLLELMIKQINYNIHMKCDNQKRNFS